MYPVELSERLGHTSVWITMNVYAHVTPDLIFSHSPPPTRDAGHPAVPWYRQPRRVKPHRSEPRIAARRHASRR